MRSLHPGVVLVAIVLGLVVSCQCQGPQGPGGGGMPGGGTAPPAGNGATANPTDPDPAPADPYAFEVTGDLERDFATASTLYSRALTAARKAVGPTPAWQEAEATYLELRRRRDALLARPDPDEAARAELVELDRAVKQARDRLEALIAARIQADPASRRIAERCEALRRQLWDQKGTGPGAPPGGDGLTE